MENLGLIKDVKVTFLYTIMASRFLSFKERGDLGGSEGEDVLGKSVWKKERREKERRNGEKKTEKKK